MLIADRNMQLTAEDFRQMSPNDVCDQCKTKGEGIGWFAIAFRKNELRHGRADPGNLCGSCAGSVTGKRIGAANR